MTVLRTWKDESVAARRVELQKRLALEVDEKARQPLLREYEAIEWVAKERGLALPRDPEEDAMPTAYVGGRKTKYWVSDEPLRMSQMLEREMEEGSGYSDAKHHAMSRVDLDVRGDHGERTEESRLSHRG